MRTYVSTLILIFISLGLFAQDSKVTTGKVKYQEGKYKEALESLNTALEDPGSLSKKKVPEAYYYRGKSYMSLMSKTAYDQLHEELETMVDFPFLALEDFKSAIATSKDENDTYAKLASVDLITVRNMMLQGGLTSINTFSTLEDGPDRTTLVNEAYKYLNAALDIQEDYLVHDLLGQVDDATGKKKEAYEHYFIASELIESDPPGNPDLYVGYLFYRKARYEMYEMENTSAALSTIKTGEAMVDREFNKYDAVQREQSIAVYEQIKDDLLRFKLNSYMNRAGSDEESYAAMSEAVKDNPYDYTIRVAFAQLCETLGKEDEAINAYLDAGKIDPNQFLAWFNLGAIYTNKAVDIKKVSNELDDIEEAARMDEEANVEFANALTYLEKAYGVKPTDLEVLRALQNVAIQLNDGDRYQKYLGEYKALTGN